MSSVCHRPFVPTRTMVYKVMAACALLLLAGGMSETAEVHRDSLQEQGEKDQAAEETERQEGQVKKNILPPSRCYSVNITSGTQWQDGKVVLSRTMNSSASW